MNILDRFLKEMPMMSGEGPMSMDDIQMRICKTIRDNPMPKDEIIHGLADELGIEPDVLEEHVYMILGSFLGAGKAKEKNFTPEDADPNELAMGIKVEMEHTTDPKLAKRIALDHLAEIEDYYTRLKKMEEEAGIKD